MWLPQEPVIAAAIATNLDFDGLMSGANKNNLGKVSFFRRLESKVLLNKYRIFSLK